MDIPLAIPRSEKLLPNLFLQERSLVKSYKKVGGGGGLGNEMNGQKTKANKQKN